MPGTPEQLARQRIGRMLNQCGWIVQDYANLPEPDVLAQEITDDLQTALEQFGSISNDLKPV